MAARYWVGGTGNWQAGNTANWSATSGGAGGASVPTAADTANFNASSGTGTVYVNGDMPCLSFTTQGFTGNLNCTTYGGYISHYNGSCVIGTTNSNGGTYNIRNRATGTTAYALTINVPCTLNTYEKLGAGTATYTISWPNVASTGNGGGLQINTVSHAVTSGTLTITNASSYAGVNVNGPCTFTGNTIINGGTLSSMNLANVTWNAGGATAQLNQSVNGQGTWTIRKALTFNTTTGTYSQSYSGTWNLYTATISIATVANQISLGQTLNIYSGAFTLNDTTGSVYTIMNVNLYGGTFTYGGAGVDTCTIQDLNISGGTAKTIAAASSTRSYLTVRNLTVSGTATTYPAYAFYWKVNGGIVNCADANLTTGNFASFADLTVFAFNYTNVRFTGYNLTAKNIVFDGMYGYTFWFGMGVLSATTMSTSNVSEAARLVFGPYNNQNTAVINATSSYAFNYVDFYGITATGAACSGSTLGDAGNNTGITFTAPVTRYFIGAGTTKAYDSTGSWSTTSGGATGASVPRVHDTAIFDAASGGPATVCTISRRVPATVTATSYQGTITTPGGITNRPVYLMKSFRSNTNSASTCSFVLGPSSSTALLNLTTTGTIYTMYYWVQSTGGAATAIFGTAGTLPSRSVWSLSGDVTTGTINWDYITVQNSSSYTVTANSATFNTDGGTLGSFGTGVVRCINGFFRGATLFQSTTLAEKSASTTVTFNLYTTNMQIGKISSSGSGIGWIIIRSYAPGITIASIENTRVNGGFSYLIDATSSNALQVGDWLVSGYPGDLVEVRGYTAGSQSYMNYTGTTVVSADYLNIKDSAVTPANKWYAGTHSTNSGNNSGWIFTAPPSGNSLFFGSNF